ncbi:MAG: cell division protein FtsQ/DivIB, partial [Desulfobacterales bacterium]|nr:cell division protein FtsQ/DivIB [Desulfobacterales bacterium]
VQDKLYYMNQWGGVFKEVDAGENFDYPVITGIAPEGDEREKDLHYALQVLKSLAPETAPWTLDNLSEIHVREGGDVSLYFSSLPVVVNLKGEDLAEKMDDLKRLVEHLEKTGRIHMVRGINLNYRDAAVVAFKKG